MTEKKKRARKVRERERKKTAREQLLQQLKSYEGFTYIGSSNKFMPWNPYRGHMPSDPMLHFWKCNNCGCTVYANHPEPYCTCRMKKSGQTPKIYSWFKSKLRALFDTIMKGGSRSWI